MAFEFFIDLVGQAQTCVIHCQQESFDFKTWIEFGLDDADGVDELGDAFESEIFGLHGDDDGVGGSQGVDRNQAERRGAVDQNVVILRGNRLQQVFNV